MSAHIIQAHAQVALATKALIEAASSFSALQDPLEDLAIRAKLLVNELSVKTEECNNLRHEINQMGEISHVDTHDQFLDVIQRCITLTETQHLLLLKSADELRQADYEPLGSGLKSLVPLHTHIDDDDDGINVLTELKGVHVDVAALRNAAARLGMRQRLMQSRRPAAHPPSTPTQTPQRHAPASPIEISSIKEEYEAKLTRREREMDLLHTTLKQQEGQNDELREEVASLKRVLWDERRNHQAGQREAERLIMERDHIISEMSHS